MVCSDFLSRRKHDESNLHEIIPILFDMQSLFKARYYNTGEENTVEYLVQTWSEGKSSGIKLPEVHGVGKSLDPTVQPVKQVLKPIAVTKTEED